MTIFFWIIVILTILLLFIEIFINFTDGAIIGIILSLWIAYGIAYYIIPQKEKVQPVEYFKYERTSAGLHVFRGKETYFTSDPYLIENIEDTSKVRVVIKEFYNSNGNLLGDRFTVIKQ